MSPQHRPLLKSLHTYHRSLIASITSETGSNILALGFGALDVDQLDESELALLGDEAATLFECLNSEEVIQVLTLPAVVEQ